MAVRSRYEGADLEELLEKVRTELGSGTKIVSANKIRAGGIAGFFARERFEVIVEHDGSALLAPPATDVESDPETSVRPRDLAPSLLDLVDQVSDEERAAAPRISTESEPFAAVMDRVARGAGMESRPEASAQADDLDELDEVDITDAEVDEAEIEVQQPAAEPVAAADTAPAVEAPTPSPVPVPAPVTLPSGPGHTGALVKMGLPATYVPAVGSPAALEAALRSSLGRLPAVPPLPKGTGSVVAVIGERQAAMRIARDLAADAGLDPDSVTLATRRRLPARTPAHLTITDTDDAAEKRRSWRRRDRPSVVVIEAELGGDKPAWAYHVLAALEPEAAWGVVDATRKTEDIAAWMHGLGGLDALAVNDIDATVTPAAVLQLDVPVGRIDDRPASPALWAALLTERLAA